MIVQTPTRRLVLLSSLAAALGVAGGGAAWVLLHLIDLITNLALFHRFSTESVDLRHLEPGWPLVVAALGGALAVSLLARWAPIIRGHGIPEAMEAILTRQSRIAPRTAVAKPISAAVAIGTGAPFGAEGPIIVTGGSLGSLLGQVLPVSAAERKILLACGAAAGMAATFGSPLAAVVLAIELLLFELSVRAFVPLVVATAVAGGMHAALFGAGPLFDVPAHDLAGLAALPAFALLGLACGALATLITKGLVLIEEGYRRLPVGEFWHPIIGAAGFAAVGLVVPEALGVGYAVTGDILAGRLAVGAVAGIAVAKLIAWWLALGSGNSGGTLAPILMISAAFGTVVGAGLNQALPGPDVAVAAFAVVAMAATFGAATRATFASIVFVFELTRDYNVILPLMLATVVADLVFSALNDESIMTEKLARRGLRLGRYYGVDPFSTTAVHQIMTAPVATLPAGATVADGRRWFQETGHSACPLVEDDRVVTMVDRRDLLLDDLDDGAPLLTSGRTGVQTIGVDARAQDALQLMVLHGVEHVPVVDAEGRLAGMCTRTDLLEVRRRQLDHERPERGLLSR